MGRVRVHAGDSGGVRKDSSVDDGELGEPVEGDL